MDPEKDFFGRRGILDLLKKRVLGLKDGYRQNVALLGNPYVGKSAILKNFMMNFDDTDVIMIYLDLEHKDFGYLFSKFAGSLLYNYSKTKDLPLYDNLNLLCESTKGLIPQSVQVIMKIQDDVSRGKLADCFLGLMTLPEIFTYESGKFCMLIFDEFQNLESLAIPNIFQDLGKKIMTQKRCFYVMSSSYPQLAKTIIIEKLSLLFGNFETLHVEPFDSKTSQDFIDYHLGEYKIGAQLRNFLADFTGGFPLYLNLICREMKNLSAYHKQNEIYMPILSQAIENMIFDRWGSISRHFELIINDLCGGKGNQIIAPILMTISNEKHKLDDLIASIAARKTHITQRVSRLLELGIIVKNGNFHYFKDKVFKYWIKYIYQRRLKDVELAPDKQRKQFKEDLNRLFDDFRNSSRKDLSSRIVELLACFDNEAFDLNGRKYKLPLFREILPFKMKNEVGNYIDLIKATACDGNWFIFLKKDTMAEGDITLIVNEAKKMGRKPERCVIIALSDLDDNIRLKALQERFWIWSESELNTLLNLFDKPYIVR